MLQRSRVPVDRLSRAFSDRTRLRILHLLQEGELWRLRGAESIRSFLSELDLGCAGLLLVLDDDEAGYARPEACRRFGGQACVKIVKSSMNPAIFLLPLTARALRSDCPSVAALRGRQSTDNPL
jgi:hypothetical protein